MGKTESFLRVVNRLFRKQDPQDDTVDLPKSVRAELVEALVNRPFDTLRANGDTLKSTVL